MDERMQLIETDPPECRPEALAMRIAELERLVRELRAPHAHELETLRRALERRLRADRAAGGGAGAPARRRGG